MSIQASNILNAFQMVIQGNNFQQAEQWVGDHLTDKNFLMQLLMIADQNTNKLQERQMALTQISRAIKDHWNPKNNQVKMVDQEDKLALKGSILEGILRCTDSQLIKQYKDILASLIATEGTNWVNFHDEAFNRLKNAQTMDEVSGCLAAVEQLFARNEIFPNDISASTLYSLQAKGFPIIQNFAGQLLQNYSPQTASIVNSILKIYHHSIFVELSDITAHPQFLQNWLAFVKVIYDFKLPENLTSLPVQPQEADIRAKNPMFKNKKMCGKIMLQFITKHAVNKNNIKRSYTTNVPQLFEEKYAVPFLESFMKTIQTQDSIFTSPSDLYYAYKYLQYSLKFQKTFQTLYNHFDNLLFNICLPSMKYTQQDYNTFMNDPMEYIRKEEDQNTYQIKNRNSVMELVDKILSVMGEQMVLKLFSHIGLSLQKKQDNITNTKLEDDMIDGFLYCLGRIKDHIYKYDNLRPQLEPCLGQIVINEFNNQNPLIRARTCWLFSKYSDMEFQDRNFIINSVGGVSKCIQEKGYMPIQVSAAIALNSMLAHKEAQDILKPNLQSVLNIYISMMSNTESEELIDALDGIIEVFQQDIDPYANNLINNLMNSYANFISQESSNNNNGKKKQILVDDDEDDNTASGAQQCLKAITRILDAPLLDQTVQSLEPMILQLLQQIFIQDDQVLMDDASNILNLMLYKSKQISEQMWFYFSVLVYNITGIPEPCKQQIGQLKLDQNSMQILQNMTTMLGCEYIEIFLTPIKNFLCRGKDSFLQRSDIFGFSCLNLLMQMIDKVYNEGSEVEKTQVLTLYICLLENYRGQVDNQVETIIQNCLSRINQANQFQTQKNIVILNLEIVCISMWYNTTLTLQILEKFNYSQQFLQDLIQNGQNFTQDYEKQRVLLGICSFLQLGSNIPQSLQPAIKYIMSWVVKLTSEILELKEKEDDQLSDDEDDVIEETTTGDIQFKKTKKLIMQYNQNQNNIQEQDDDSDDSYSPDRDLENNSFAYKYDSVLDQIDEVLFVEQIMINLAQNDSSFQQGLMSMLSGDEQNALSNNIQKAKQILSGQNQGSQISNN